MSSPLDKSGYPPDYASDLKDMEIRDAARLLCQPGILEELARLNPERVDELKDKLDAFVTELRGGVDL